ncbi:MAG: stage II sporulation protein P [Limnochordaceae bacterium]|nr:stage II sporulation protein P [Limnochordaceae bacterium]
MQHNRGSVALILCWIGLLCATRPTLASTLSSLSHPAPKVLVAATAAAASRRTPAPAQDGWERRQGGYYTVRRSPGGEVVTHTSLELGPGDIYIDAENNRYQVTRVDPAAFVVWVRLEGREILPKIDEASLAAAAGSIGPQGRTIPAPVNRVPFRWRGRAPLVGIYFTHSDESYEPTSGTASKLPRGDIFKVGEVLAEGLRRQGLRVDVREDIHAPHDGLAYLRSRSTIRRLLPEMPAVLVDVHRDAVPADEYRTTIQGRPASKVRIVVGRQNPQFAANFDFAKRMKAVADRLYPGLVLGIFAGHGNYNQDVSPRATLLEFGTYSLPLDQAATAADLFSRVIPVAAGLTPGIAAPATYGGWQGIGWTLAILVVVALGIVFFLDLNRRLPRPN